MEVRTSLLFALPSYRALNVEVAFEYGIAWVTAHRIPV